MHKIFLIGKQRWSAAGLDEKNRLVFVGDALQNQSDKVNHGCLMK
ncbi:MAG: hypothetical protein AB8B87_26810 [Granulosicoccus sp.]